MNKLLALVSGLLVLPLTLPGAEIAQARLFCLSIRFQQGTFSSGFGDVTLDLSTVGFDAPNGELEPTFSQPDHASGFHLFNTTIEDTIEDGIVNLNVPAFADSNNNGFPDFFEVSQAASGVSTGVYSSAPVDSGTVQATWNRAAGSKEGSCVLGLTSRTFGSLGDFSLTFELLEYTGTLNYTPTATNVSGSLNLTNSGDSSIKLAGSFSFLKSATNRFNDLELQPGVWTNSAGQSLSYTNDVFERDATMTTNYFGFVDFDDGDPNTPNPDYFTWILSVDDPNDSNRNGIPDFSDDPGHGDPLPSLSLSLGSTNLLLSIHPGLGTGYEIQRINSLNDTNWTTVLSLNVTNDPQIVPLPFPTSALSFWRLREP